MKYIDEFRNLKLAKKLSNQIHKIIDSDSRRYNFMEVCGTHTNTFFRFGLKSLLPENLQLISGPGCPVCVTDASYIDNAISFAELKDTIITTFGDMIKVPGSHSSLYKERTKGKDIRVVYSPLDALGIAENNPSKNVIFLGVGFETTAPTIAIAILEAKKKGVRNFFVYSAHKLIPPAMKQLLKDANVCIDGFILPAHVTAIIGADSYNFLKQYNMPGVVAGFEPLDMLQGVLMLIRQIRSGRPKVEIQYNRVAKKKGNRQAQRILKKVFKISDSKWRGLGNIPLSALVIKREFRDFDAEKNFKINILRTRTPKYEKYCICGEILKGIRRPSDCTLFAKTCTPDEPKGPCMVSSEGSCSIYYEYGR